MRFIYLIIFSDFIHVLYSARKLYTKNQYFSNHKLFSTISLLQKQRLNPRNYSKQALIMELLVEATDNGMHMHAKIQNIIKCKYL
jgi:hypothetical protein